MADPSNKEKCGRGRKGEEQSQVQESNIVDRINEEIGQVVPPELFRDSIREPSPKLAWTKSLDGYEEARFSAENALRKLYAATDAARAGFESQSPLLEVFLHKVRAGPRVPGEATAKTMTSSLRLAKASSVSVLGRATATHSQRLRQLPSPEDPS